MQLYSHSRKRRVGRRGLCLVLLLCSASVASASDMLVSPGAVWKYLDDGSDQGTRWTEPGFDDGDWPSGPAQLGYGDGDEATVVSYGPDPANKHITTYFRHVFDVAEPSLLTSLMLKILRDDGAVVYLNGDEIFRSNMPPGPVTYQTTACCWVGGVYENLWQKAILDPSLLVRGDNVLAVEIHQYSATNPDMSFDFALEANLGTSVVWFAWAGALTPTSIRVNARATHDTTQVRLHVSENPDFSEARVSGWYTAAQAINNRVVSIPMQGLTPGTSYHYAIEVDGQLDLPMQGRFTTPVSSPLSFTFAFASCADTGANNAVFDTIRQHDPLFFMHMGDFHNEDIGVNDIGLFRAAYDLVLASPAQSALYRDVPIAYMWDDHDYGPDDSDCDAPGREASRLAYQEYVPHYPLPAGSGDVPIYQAFSIGRVRFIVTDLRSERTAFTEPDTPDKSMLGRLQKPWFEDELLAANGVYPVIVWVNTIPWISEASHEDWSRYTFERQEIADFIRNNGIQGLFMISGDAHMLAIDDGTNSDYATGGGAPFPVMHAAAMNAVPHIKGGPYSEGAYPGTGQFGLMTITDDGVSPVCVTWSGRNWQDQEIVSWSTCAASPPPADTDSDGTDDVDDCSFADATTWAGPSQITDLRLARDTGPDVLFSWSSQDSSAGPSTLYDIVRGKLQDLRRDGDFSGAVCFLSGHPDTPYVDSGEPPDPGDCDYFLLRAINPCGSSGFGEAEPFAPRLGLDTEIPCALP